MLPTGLHRHPRTGFYYFRRRIPADILRCYPGKRELVYSLKTKVYRDAVVRLNAKQSAVFAEWERHRQRLADQAVRRQINAVTVIDSLTPERIDAICQDFEVMSLAGDEARRLSDDPYEPEEVEEYVTGYSEANRDMKIAVATGNLDGLRAVMEQFLSFRRLQVSGSEADLRRLLLAFCRAAIRTNEKLLRRYDGEDVPTPERAGVPNAPRLSTVIRAHLDYYEKLKKPAMLKKLKAALSLFLEIVGDKTIDLLRQRDLETYFETVQSLPPRWKDICRQRKLSPLDLAGLQIGEISKATFEGTYVSTLSSFVTYCEHKWQDTGWPMTLTVKGTRYTGSRRDSVMGQRAFAPEELSRLFHGPEMAAFARDPERAHKFWLPHLGLFTGARVNELCQLNPQSDIRQDRLSGIWFLDITDESDGPEGMVKSIKTKGSRRKVPIHSKLIELGFLEYVDGLKKGGSVLLFPGFPPSRRKASPEAAKWFRGFLSKIGLRDETADARVVGMHAFRHTLLHVASALGVVNAEIITGHTSNVTNLQEVQDGQAEGAKSRVVRKYEGELPLANKKEILERICYEGLEFYKPKKPGEAT